MSKSIQFTIVLPKALKDYDKHYQVEIFPRNPLTKCKITMQYTPIYPSGWDLKALGIGICKHGDTYDRETGCRMALKSALRMVDDDEVKALIWAAYLDMFPAKDRVKPEQTFSFVFRMGMMPTLKKLIEKTIAGGMTTL